MFRAAFALWPCIEFFSSNIDIRRKTDFINWMHVDYIAILSSPRALTTWGFLDCIITFILLTYVSVLRRHVCLFCISDSAKKRFGCVNVINFTSLILIRWENKQSVFIASINSGDKLITLSYRCLDPKYGNNLPCGFKMKTCIGTKHNLRPKSHPTQWRMRTNSNRSPEWLKWLKNILKKLMVLH